MTESELLASNDFIAWCGAWERDRHCPAQFADWCLDQDFTLGFEACMWAYETEERGVSGGGRKGPFWHTRPSSSCIWWGIDGEQDNTNFPSYVPIGDGMHQLDSFPAAIAYYLTHFDPIIAAKYPPKRALATV